MNSLRAFEAVARHQSFSTAAAELCVTVPALSSQVKKLEEDLGRPLFERQHNAISLTEEGHFLFDGVGEAFHHIRKSWAYVTGMAPPKMLRITTMQSLMSGWLAETMQRFWQEVPDLAIEFDTTIRLRDLSAPSYDMAIRYDFDRPQSYFQKPLYQDWLTPMMAPEIADRIAGPDCLLSETLIGCREIDFDIGILPWTAWFRTAGIETEPRLGPQFSDTNHAHDLAIQGGGIAMGRAFLALHHLEAGRLVAPFRLAIRPRVHFWLACPMGRQDNHLVLRLMDHLVCESRRVEPFEKGRVIINTENGVAQGHDFPEAHLREKMS